jgi:hypothetical protein
MGHHTGHEAHEDRILKPYSSSFFVNFVCFVVSSFLMRKEELRSGSITRSTPKSPTSRLSQHLLVSGPSVLIRFQPRISREFGNGPGPVPSL